MVAVMQEQGDDARALYVVQVDKPKADALLECAADLGYGPAEARMSLKASGFDEEMAFMWAERASKNGDRLGLYRLGLAYLYGLGCAKDKAKAIEHFKAAAELQLAMAQSSYGEFAFGASDWERYFWWGRAVVNGGYKEMFRSAVLRLLPSFEAGQNGRILHTVGPVMRVNVEPAPRNLLLGTGSTDEEVKGYHRVVKLYDAMLGRARRAIQCWSIVGRRSGIVRDIRVVIAKMACEEAWLWM
jgi:TPR repeat protein